MVQARMCTKGLTGTADASSSCCKSRRLCSDTLLGGGCLKARLSSPVTFSFSDSAATFAVATSSFSSWLSTKGVRGEVCAKPVTKHHRKQHKRFLCELFGDIVMGCLHSETPPGSYAAPGALCCPQPALQVDRQCLSYASHHK